MSRLVFALLLTGCATAGPTGPAPSVAAPRAVSLQLDVTGSDKAELDAYLEWVLKDNGLLRRVSSGADLRVAVDANLELGLHMLAGTDLKLTVRLRGDGLDESRTWTRTGLTSGVPGARDAITTEAVLWALGRAAGAAASAGSQSQSQSQSPPPASRIELPTAGDATDTPPPTATTPSTHKKKRRR